MLISAVQKFTMLDYPGKISCIIFTPGCNFRCGYCHNPEFVLPEKIEQIRHSFIPENNFFNFLEKRKKVLDGVVITGGEPTIMPDLISFVRKIKELGFLVKLDTNGSDPEKLANLLKENLLDYVAMDVKTSLERYPEVGGPIVQANLISQSIEIIKNSYIPYEFRSTIVKEIHPRDVLEKMADLIAGAEKVYLQTFRPQNTLNPEFAVYHPYNEVEMAEIANNIFLPKVKFVGLR
jgi:pyruvate formate lyase activating enzyme